MDQEYIAQTALDQMVGTDQGQLLKALIPYFPPRQQQFLSVFAKARELSNTVALFTKPSEAMHIQAAAAPAPAPVAAPVEAAEADGTAFVFMGHGTSHTAKVSYSQMQTQMEQLGYDNVFIGTVEGEPEDTSCEAVIEKLKEAGYKKVILRPLMVVAGDHANNDMAGDDDDSWKSQFEASGAFDKIDTQIAGLGEISAIQDLYVAHTKAAMDGNDAAVSEESEETAGTLEDGTYEAEFDTDSGMFHVNEANDGKGILTVKDGKMTIHISLVSKNIVNLYVGKAADAQKDGAELLQPTTDTITYDDGSTEEVYGFDVPVKALDETFDLALVGTKGKWYDHEVSVSDPVKAE